VPAAAPAASAASAAASSPQRIEIRGDAQSDTALRRRDPVAKQVYGREELDRHGDTSVSDVLKRLPGVNLQGGSPRLRGLGSGYTLILLNGEPAPPGFSLDNLAPSQVERIEITRGPSAEHSAQAVAGTINIILRQAPRQRQREFRASLNYQQRLEPQVNGVVGDRLGDVSATLPYSLYRWRSGSTTTTDEAARDANGRPREWLSVAAERARGYGFNLSPRANWRLGGGGGRSEGGAGGGGGAVGAISGTSGSAGSAGVGGAGSAPGAVGNRPDGAGRAATAPAPSGVTTVDWNGVFQHNLWRNEGEITRIVLAGSTPLSAFDEWTNRGFWRLARSQVQLTHKWPEGAQGEIKLGGERSASHYSTPVVGRDAAGAVSVERLTEGRSAAKSGQISSKWTWPVGEAHRWVLGAELERRFREESRVQLFNGQPLVPAGGSGQDFSARIEREAAFVQDEWEVSPQWATSLGVRAERITTIGDAVAGVPTARNRSQVVTPLLHLTYKFAAPAAPSAPVSGAGGPGTANNNSGNAVGNTAGSTAGAATPARAATPPSRDLLRASLTRSYKAPDLSALIARPNISADYPVSGGNTALVPDGVGNPELQPELATGLDVAYEKYLAQGGVLSASIFHRRITGLIRRGLALETVPWAAQPRWVSRPQNLSGASSSGIELEAKGRLDEWWVAAGLTPFWSAGSAPEPASSAVSVAAMVAAASASPGPASVSASASASALPSAWKALNLRASLALYRSQVDGIPGPDNRLDGQQPWSLTLGADQAIPQTAFSWGGSYTYTPRYGVQQTDLTQLTQGYARRADLYVMWAPDKQTSWRFGAFNIAPHLAGSRTEVQDGAVPATFTDSQRRVRSFFSLSLSLKM
jgi:outer membrane receptor for ferrienterochelin and colicins